MKPTSAKDRALRAILILFASMLLVFASALACQRPRIVTIHETWPLNTYAYVLYDEAPSSALTALQNWENAINQRFPCANIQLQDGGYQVLNLYYEDLGVNPDSGNPIYGGVNSFYDVGRVHEADIYINSNVTDPLMVTEVAAHEVGHTFG